jgi:hypothetical protein
MSNTEQMQGKRKKKIETEKKKKILQHGVSCKTLIMI